MALLTGGDVQRREFITLLGGVADCGACVATGPDAADRRTYGLCGERFNRAVLARGVPGCAREVGMDGRQ